MLNSIIHNQNKIYMANRSRTEIVGQILEIVSDYDDYDNGDNGDNGNSGGTERLDPSIHH